MNNDPVDRSEDVNEANEAENENKNEVPTLADGADIEELPDELAAQAIPETTEEQQHCSGRIPVPVTRFELSFTGKKYAETTATTIYQTPIQPDTHMSLNKGQAWDHVFHYTMTQL